jgi:hypothetical protein
LREKRQQDFREFLRKRTRPEIDSFRSFNLRHSGMWTARAQSSNDFYPDRLPKALGVGPPPQKSIIREYIQNRQPIASIVRFHRDSASAPLIAAAVTGARNGHPAASRSAPSDSPGESFPHPQAPVRTRPFKI